MADNVTDLLAFFKIWLWLYHIKRHRQSRLAYTKYSLLHDNDYCIIGFFWQFQEYFSSQMKISNLYFLFVSQKILTELNGTQLFNYFVFYIFNGLKYILILGRIQGWWVPSCSAVRSISNWLDDLCPMTAYTLSACSVTWDAKCCLKFSL